MRFGRLQVGRTLFVDSDSEEEDSGNEDSNDEDADVDEENDFLEDPIISDASVSHPIGNPREYFLRVFEVRSAEIFEEWAYIVYWLEESIRQRVR